MTVLRAIPVLGLVVALAGCGADYSNVKGSDPVPAELVRAEVDGCARGGTEAGRRQMCDCIGQELSKMSFGDYRALFSALPPLAAGKPTSALTSTIGGRLVGSAKNCLPQLAR